MNNPLDSEKYVTHKQGLSWLIPSILGMLTAAILVVQFVGTIRKDVDLNTQKIDANNMERKEFQKETDKKLDDIFEVLTEVRDNQLKRDEREKTIKELQSKY